ncbi:UNVERIFIED_CONTAM: hypothetical protein PYX00_008756 [Menopon gallinae]|uniref:Cystinosin homolog n=1 Tax=Menopon gallinae TaxID=328185 RepID=A0AAW2HP52_9NEOP
MWLTGFSLLLVLHAATSDLTFSPDSFKLCINETAILDIHIKEKVKADVTIFPDHEDHIVLSEQKFHFDGADLTQKVQVTGKNPGKVIVKANISGSFPESFKTKVAHVIVQKKDFWNIVSDVVGWLYFVAWSISFYPQMYENWKRRSVIGLNFDFLSLNLVGFVLYSLFNIGLYSSETIQAQYEKRYPGGVIPVQLNDIFFSVHAALAVILTGIQCFLYERGDQTVSRFARCLFVGYALFLGISLILAATDTAINWLDFLLFCSYVKLSITLIKYVPQAYMNYKRKSTVGWSIGNIFLDTTGGLLSMIQMIINAHNFDDWASIFGDPTKFGLGLFSVLFDIFFIVQHYVLYRNREPLA